MQLIMVVFARSVKRVFSNPTDPSYILHFLLTNVVKRQHWLLIRKIKILKEIHDGAL